MLLPRTTWLIILRSNLIDIVWMDWECADIAGYVHTTQVLESGMYCLVCVCSCDRSPSVLIIGMLSLALTADRQPRTNRYSEAAPSAKSISLNPFGMSSHDAAEDAAIVGIHTDIHGLPSAQTANSWEPGISVRGWYVAIKNMPPEWGDLEGLNKSSPCRSQLRICLQPMSRQTRPLEALFILSSISVGLSLLGRIIGIPSRLSFATTGYHALILLAHIVHKDIPRLAVVIFYVRTISTNIWRSVVNRESEGDKIGEKEEVQELVQPETGSHRPRHPVATLANLVVVYLLAVTWLVVNWSKISYMFRHALHALVVLGWILIEIAVLVAIARICTHMRNGVLQGQQSADST